MTADSPQIVQERINSLFNQLSIEGPIESKIELAKKIRATEKSIVDFIDQNTAEAKAFIAAQRGAYAQALNQLGQAYDVLRELINDYQLMKLKSNGFNGESPCENARIVTPLGALATCHFKKEVGSVDLSKIDLNKLKKFMDIEAIKKAVLSFYNAEKIAPEGTLITDKLITTIR